MEIVQKNSIISYDEDVIKISESMKVILDAEIRDVHLQYYGIESGSIFEEVHLAVVINHSDLSEPYSIIGYEKDGSIPKLKELIKILKKHGIVDLKNSYRQALLTLFDQQREQKAYDRQVMLNEQIRRREEEAAKRKMIAEEKREKRKEYERAVNMYVDATKRIEKNNKIVRCPKCKSTSIQYTNKKLSLGRAIVGDVVAGPAGAVLGGLSSKKGYAVCLNCGKRWKV